MGSETPLAKPLLQHLAQAASHLGILRQDVGWELDTNGLRSPCSAATQPSLFDANPGRCTQRPPLALDSRTVIAIKLGEKGTKTAHMETPGCIRSVRYPPYARCCDAAHTLSWGNVIDVLSVLATLVGLATSLGLGVQQINAGLNQLFGIGIDTTIQVILIAIITGFATMSVMAGLDSGVRRLSEANMLLAALFMLFLLVVGPTLTILKGATQNLGFYMAIFPEMSLWTETFEHTNWQGSRTVFYWAWWISWSPFVGIFIARISKGRNVKEFVIGVYSLYIGLDQEAYVETVVQRAVTKAESDHQLEEVVSSGLNRGQIP
jgi:hypothetical protein